MPGILSALKLKEKYSNQSCHPIKGANKFFFTIQNTKWLEDKWRLKELQTEGLSTEFTTTPKKNIITRVANSLCQSHLIMQKISKPNASIINNIKNLFFIIFMEITQW